MLRIAHVSDMHVRSTAGVEWSKMLFNKRIFGYANLVLRRGIVGATSVPCRRLVGRPNALVQLQAHYHHCGEAASEKCLSAATFVR
jgi:hypothetical protein